PQMAFSSWRSASDNGAGGSTRHSAPRSSPEVPRRPAIKISLQWLVVATLSPIRLSAGTTATSSEAEDTAVKAAREKLACSDSKGCDAGLGANTQFGDPLSIIRPATGASIICANRETNVRANSRPRRRELISSAKV